MQNQTENFISREQDDGSFVDEDGDGWNDSIGPVFGPIIVAVAFTFSCCFCCGMIYFVWKAKKQHVTSHNFISYY